MVDRCGGGGGGDYSYSNYSRQNNWGPPGGQAYAKPEGKSPTESEKPGSDEIGSSAEEKQPETTASEKTSGQGSSAEGKEKELLDAINKVRQEHGLNPLTNTSTLNQASKDNDALNNQLGLGHHVDLGKYGADGEITAMASGGISAEQAVDMWLNSPGHRAILLDPNQTEVGVSVDGDFATADFV